MIANDDDNSTTKSAPASRVDLRPILAANINDLARRKQDRMQREDPLNCLEINDTDDWACLYP